MKVGIGHNSIPAKLADLGAKIKDTHFRAVQRHKLNLWDWINLGEMIIDGKAQCKALEMKYKDWYADAFPDISSTQLWRYEKLAEGKETILKHQGEILAKGLGQNAIIEFVKEKLAEELFLDLKIPRGISGSEEKPRFEVKPDWSQTQADKAAPEERKNFGLGSPKGKPREFYDFVNLARTVDKWSRGGLPHASQMYVGKNLWRYIRLLQDYVEREKKGKPERRV